MYWWEHAACHGETRLDPTLPNLGNAERRRIARWYCSGCPVKAECAADALRHGDIEHIRGGIWTGSSTRGGQARKVKTRLARIAAGADQ